MLFQEKFLETTKMFDEKVFLVFFMTKTLY